MPLFFLYIVSLNIYVNFFKKKLARLGILYIVSHVPLTGKNMPGQIQTKHKQFG